MIVEIKLSASSTSG